MIAHEWCAAPTSPTNEPMQTLPIVLACAAVSVTSSALTSVFLQPSPADAAGAPTGAREDAARAAAAVDRLTARLDALEGRGGLAAPAAPVGARVSLEASDAEARREALEALVRELVDPDALVAVEEPEPAGDEPRTPDEAIAAILAAGVDSPEARALWEAAHARGELHEVLAAMEARLEGEPESVEKHFERARAYYAAAGVHPGNTDGNWWVDSNDAYTRALEIDPNHWDARYQKARNMSFWPTAYGGQAEAIRHFETLVEQQSGRSPEARFAKTYRWLGNLYDQQGRTDDARAAWESGLALFPGDAQLQAKLRSLR